MHQIFRNVKCRRPKPKPTEVHTSIHTSNLPQRQSPEAGNPTGTQPGPKQVLHIHGQFQLVQVFLQSFKRLESLRAGESSSALAWLEFGGSSIEALQYSRRLSACFSLDACSCRYSHLVGATHVQTVLVVHRVELFSTHEKSRCSKLTNYRPGTIGAKLCSLLTIRCRNVCADKLVGTKARMMGSHGPELVWTAKSL